MKKSYGGGFGLRLALAIVLTVFAVLFLAAKIAISVLRPGMSEDVSETLNMVFLASCAALTVLSALQFTSAFLGKKSKAANAISIIVGILCIPVYLLGIIGIVGGIRGIKNLKHNKTSENLAENPTESEPLFAENVNSAAASNLGGGIAENNFDDYVIDYENKPLVSSILDLSNSENLLLKNENGETYEFKQLYIKADNNELYVLTETVGLSSEEGGGLVLFRIDYENDLVHIVHDEDIFKAICEAFETEADKLKEQKIKRSEFTLDLYDASIDEKTWKQFKKTATQEELAAIAIGAKYRICHSRILNIIYTIGIILSIALFWPTGGYSLIGYPVFAFLATKSIRYEDTFSQSYRKLTKENRAFVDNYFNGNIGLTILDTVIKLGIFWITIPYQAILIMIGLIAPNFVLS